ncbi:phosphonate metabolism transcriptional regulator PhnF [Rhizobium laguerreae]|uniref:phosphonate metabolism transcriptional regulator PhnF n=1 Tax=Rhizobium laguerreae TaxID=1076926 RepID=UPI00103B6AB3|nr:phosphonate metabolism transcriptional regulator PhnF [Rhizobium laguerreae]TBX99049.1 phosphonate metabolism transcriptional regulator PhnF [Rhizobium laguerreae]
MSKATDNTGTPKRPLWRELSDALEAEISSGQYLPGERLPTESQLSDRYGAHRLTVRRALQRLKERNLVRIEQGRGSFVRESTITHSVGSHVKLSVDASGLGRVAGRHFIESETLRPDRGILATLGLPSNASVCRVETLRLLDGHPIGVTTHYFPLPRFEGIDAKIAQYSSVTRSLEDYAVEAFEHRTSRIAARLPTASDADRLGQSRSLPILFVTTVAIDEGRRTIFMMHTRFSSQWVELAIAHSS